MIRTAVSRFTSNSVAWAYDEYHGLKIEYTVAADWWRDLKVDLVALLEQDRSYKKAGDAGNVTKVVHTATRAQISAVLEEVSFSREGCLDLAWLLADEAHQVCWASEDTTRGWCNGVAKIEELWLRWYEFPNEYGTVVEM